MKIRFCIAFASAFFCTSSAFAANYCVEDMATGSYERFVPTKKYKQTNEPLSQYLQLYSVTAKLDWAELIFTDSNGKSYTVTRLNSGDDYNGWDAIYELEDNWLYVGGAQYNHAVHLKLNAQQQWQADKIIRLKENESVGERLGRFALGMDAEQIKRDNLTAITRVDGYAVYSEALRKLFYPASSMEFKNDDLVKFGGGQAKTYVGDIPRLKTAFFKSNDGQLYSYQNEEFKSVSNGKVEPYFVGGERLEAGLIHDVPELNRSFYAIRAAIYEITEQRNGYELKKITLPRDVSELLFTRFIPTPDNQDIAIITRDDIFLLSNLEGIFPRSIPNKQINTTGSDVLPALIPELQGILFSTGGVYVAGDKAEYFHLLKKCSKANRTP